MVECYVLSFIQQFFPHRIPFASVVIAFSPIVVFSNLFLIASFIATRQVTQNTSNLIIFLISLCDLTSGVIFLPITANILLDINAKDVCLKSEIFTFLCALINVSTLLTVFLGIDRYLHMNPDIRNRQSRIKKIFKTPCIYYLIGFLVTFLMAYFAFAAFYIHGNAFIDIASFFLTSLVTTAITITACLYTKGYLRIRNFTDSNPVYCNSGGSSERPEYVRSLYKTVMVLVCLVCIHYLPLSIISIVAAILKYSKISFDGNLFAYFYEFAVLLVYASWFTNSFAILYFNKKAKNWIISKLRLKHAVNQTTNTDLDSDNMKNCKIEIELK